MIKTDINAKSVATLTIERRADIINTIVNSYFQTNKDGETEYTPYLSKIGEIIAITKYLIEGIEFDNNESIYESVINDDEVSALINDITSTYEFKSIMDTVRDVVEYKKAENIARIQSESLSLLAYKMLELIDKESDKIAKEMGATENLNQWINQQRELNSLITPEMQRDFAKKFNPDLLTDAIIKKYSESDLYKKNKEIVEANRQIREKDNKIVELQNKSAKKEQKKKIRNVITDK